MAISMGDARCGVNDIKRLMVYDELKFSNDLHKIKFIDTGSEITNNFMLIAIDGVV